jgi:hypothetical protein
MEVFEQVRAQYRDTVPVTDSFPWHDGQTAAESHDTPGSPGEWTHALALAVGPETYTIPFTEHELRAGADPDNSEARFAIKKTILETFTALESQ